MLTVSLVSALLLVVGVVVTRPRREAARVRSIGRPAPRV